MIQSWMPAVITNAFAIVALSILLFNFGHKRRRFLLRDQRIYVWMLINNIVILFLDAGTWVINGQSFPGARAMNLLFTTAFYALNPAMSLLYVCFCEIKLGTPAGKSKRLLQLYSVPIAVNLALTLASLWHPLLFNIRPDNVYERGSLLYVSFVLSYILLGVAFFRVLFYHRRVVREGEPVPSRCSSHDIASLLVFPVIPLIGGVTQIWFSPVTVVWLVPVFALLIVFINIQNSEIYTDSLTGLYNRRQTDSYLLSLVQNSAKNLPIGLAILDMDNFKQVNDSFGHLAGDNALRLMAGVLQAECDNDTFFSRYGGDEFVLITKQKNLTMIEELIGRIAAGLSRRRDSFGIRYNLTLSAGVAVWTEGMESVDSLFAVADAKLYENKARLGRRADDREFTR
jgi:diguanylate cyclase (GGDEF)-like protein